MPYCCEKFEKHIADGVIDGFENFDASVGRIEWSISGCSQCYVVEDFKFCPFCGGAVPTVLQDDLAATHKKLE